MFTRLARNALLGLAPAAMLMAASPALAQLEVLNGICDPKIKPRAPFSTRSTSLDGMTTFLSAAPALFPQGDGFAPNPPNLRPTEYNNVYDCGGDEAPNTLLIGGAGPLFTFGRNCFWAHTAPAANPIPPTTRDGPRSP